MITVIGIDPSFTGFGIFDGETATVVSTKPVADVVEEVSIIKRCDQVIEALHAVVRQNETSESDVQINLYMEAPMLNMTNNFSMYQLGALYTSVWRYAIAQGYPIYQTDRSSVMHALFGKKVIAKQEVSGFAHRKFGVLFERDAGLNKLHSYLLYRFGCGVRDGEYGVTTAARPGANRKKRIPRE